VILPKRRCQGSDGGQSAISLALRGDESAHRTQGAVGPVRSHSAIDETAERAGGGDPGPGPQGASLRRDSRGVEDLEGHRSQALQQHLSETTRPLEGRSRGQNPLARVWPL